MRVRPCPDARVCGEAPGRLSTGAVGCTSLELPRPSGGLSPENVTEAVKRVRPYAVDTASGTEGAPGRKDPEKLCEFFAAVQRAAFATPPVEPSAAPDTLSDAQSEPPVGSPA